VPLRLGTFGAVLIAGVAAAKDKAGALPPELVAPELSGVRFVAAKVKGMRAWLSPVLPLERAVRAWRALADRRAFTTVLLAGEQDLDGAAPSAALPSAQAVERLRKKRAAMEKYYTELARRSGATPGEVAPYLDPWTRWDRERKTASPSAEQLAEARELAAYDRKTLDFNEKEKRVRVAIFETTPGTVLALTGGRDSSLPDGAEVAPLFDEWRARFGARLLTWNGYGWALDVARPPTDVDVLRTLADQFALACPAARSSRGPLPVEETPAFTMARLRADLWTCHWFIE
jgi:hypothetical protein